MNAGKRGGAFDCVSDSRTSPAYRLYTYSCLCRSDPSGNEKKLKWSGAAFKRLDEKGFDAAIPAEWINFEKESAAEYLKAEKLARNLFDDGKKPEAVKLLNAAAVKIWKKAAVLPGI